jgi:hypothetical protein
MRYVAIPLALLAIGCAQTSSEQSQHHATAGAPRPTLSIRTDKSLGGDKLSELSFPVTTKSATPSSISITHDVGIRVQS